MIVSFIAWGTAIFFISALTVLAIFILLSLVAIVLTWLGMEDDLRDWVKQKFKNKNSSQ